MELKTIYQINNYYLVFVTWTQLIVFSNKMYGKNLTLFLKY